MGLLINLIATPQNTLAILISSTCTRQFLDVTGFPLQNFVNAQQSIYSR